MLRYKKKRLSPVVLLIAAVFVLLVSVFGCFVPARADSSSSAQSTGTSGSISSIDDLIGKKVGVVIGTSYGGFAEDEIEDAEVIYYKNIADTLQALRGGKVDAALFNKATLKEALRNVDDISLVNDDRLKNDVAFMLSLTNGQELCDELNAYIEKIEASGHLTELQNKWFDGADEERTAVDMSDLTGEAGTITFGIDPTKIPFDYSDSDGYKGFEMEIMTEFCRENDYALKVMTMDYEAFIPAVTGGKVDVAGSGTSVTEERKQSVLFTDKTYDGGGAIAIYTPDTAAAAPGFFESIGTSFYRTFVQDNRWETIVSGLLVTLEISVFSVLFGTIFGFVLYFARKGKNKIANGAASVLMRIVQGVPMLVILMVLYYIVFASSDLSAVWVVIIGFTITFGCTMASILMNCIGAIDRGQWEASEALGFESGNTFWQIILPQAMYQILPLYKGEFISLVKSTSIVGYVAVTDLTKASDIIRSRTFEAFFPIIATAVIYFLLAWLITSLLNLVEFKIDPEKHKKKALKGINTDIPKKDNKSGQSFSGEKGEELARFSHMEKRYDNGGVPLKDVNASVYRGDVITIIGPSGTGKSTLMRCLNRLELHTNGEVYAFGKPVPSDKKELCEMRRRMGMVFQAFNLFPHLTVIENVMFAQTHLKGRSRQEAYEYGVELLRLVGMAGKLLSYPGELSGGQKQRVAIARTLAMDPEIVLFDEPTSALDPTMVGQVLSVIKELASRGLTMMIVTHEMKFARDVSTRIFYLDQGEVYEDGTPDEVFDHPKRNRTRAFVQRLKVLRIEIDERDFDYPETQEMLETFGHQNYLGKKQVLSLRRCFEEIAAGAIIPNLAEPFKLIILAEHSEEKDETRLQFIYDGDALDPRENMDEIALELVKSSAVDISYSYEEGRNQLTVMI